MNRVKIIFCLFLFFLSFLYMSDKLKDINLLSVLIKNDKEKLISTLASTKFNYAKENDLEKTSYSNGLLNNENSSVNIINKDQKYDKPLIYIFNTHQTEEYASNVYNITPTVMTVSDILNDELKNLGKESIVEKKSVPKEVKKRGLDYSGTYTVSFEYLKENKKKYPTLKYFFDMHRDSITGNSARKVIKNKKYATLMFLVGANYNGYKENIKNIEIMKEYLNKKYPGIVRDNYIQKACSFNQNYSSKMFLVELGGPDNTLEEIYNTTKALAESINYFVEKTNEK